MKMYEYNGSLYTLDQLVQISGINKRTLAARLKKRWSIEKVVTTEVKHNGLHGHENYICRQRDCRWNDGDCVCELIHDCKWDSPPPTKMRNCASCEKYEDAFEFYYGRKEYNGKKNKDPYAADRMLLWI